MLPVYLYGVNWYKEVEAWFTVNFWECIEGEEIISNQCYICDSGFYSLNKGDLCTPCVDNAECLGGIQISVKAGYWRDQLKREEILSCYQSSACLGGFYTNLTFPVMCAEGYQGILCNDCVLNKTAGIWYMRSGKNKCSQCPNTFLNAIRIVGFIIGLLLVIYFMIWLNIWKIKESEFSILTKILTNYIQTITATISFNIEYPEVLKKVFSPG